MKKNKLYIIVPVLAVVAVAGIGLAVVAGYGPKLDEVKHRLQPAIVNKPTIKALVVEATGDPKITGKSAFGLLMGTYFKIKDAPKGPAMEPPRARWPKPFDTPKNEWIGIYAMPVPPSVTGFPKVKAAAGLTISLTDWQYGMVAEILHIGSYGSEDTSVVKLHKFISDNGYEICGAHEEEYLKGPGLLPVNQKRYLTIIRYQVRKAGVME